MAKQRSFTLEQQYEKSLLTTKRYHYRKKYGITLEQRNQMIAAQGNVCALCEQPFPSSVETCVDHCHKTNKVRSILCMQCNQALGKLKDDPALCRKAGAYLEQHQ
jgi:hypothetical protein